MKLRPILPLVVLFVGLIASALTPLPARGHGGAQALPAGGGLYYALVIGNGGYQSLPELVTAVRDARAVESMLRESYGFKTRLLVNATRAEIVAALSGYGRGLGADASLLVYYTGHGHRDAEAGKTYWLPVDATREDVSKWVGADEITAVIRAIPARHVLVISDSCYSGVLPHGLSPSPMRPSEREEFLQKMGAGHSRMMMASGRDEPQLDAGYSGHSVFADALLRGLRRIERSRFTASELFIDHVLSPVAGRTGQIPTYNPLRNSGHESGDFVFTRIKPAVPDPVPGSCDDPEEKGKLYQSYLDNFKGSPEQQKTAYEAGKLYVSRYEHCPKEIDKQIISYIRRWIARYEKAVRLYEQSKSRQP